MMNSLTRRSMVFLLALLSVSCKGPVEITVRGADDMNEGNAVTVVYFQLTSDATFKNASAASFWENNNAVLANDLAATAQKLVLYPGREEQIEVAPAKNAGFLGFAANYRNPDPQGWRVIYSAEEIKGKTVRLTVARDRLFAEVH